MIPILSSLKSFMQVSPSIYSDRFSFGLPTIPMHQACG